MSSQKKTSRALGRTIARARQQAGLTQIQLGQQLNVSPSTIAKLERGVIESPSALTIVEIAKITKVDPSQLLAGRLVSNQLPETVKLVFFGLLGCLFEDFDCLWPSLAKEAAQSPETAGRLFNRYWPLYALGQIDQAQLNFSFDLKLRFNWANFLVQNLKVRPEVKNLVLKLSSQVNLALLADLPADWLTPLLKEHYPEVSWRLIVCPPQTNGLKPWVGFYQIAQAQSGLATADNLLIDSCPLSLNQGKEIGWQTSPLSSNPELNLNLEPFGLKI